MGAGVYRRICKRYFATALCTSSIDERMMRMIGPARDTPNTAAGKKRILRFSTGSVVNET
jgi:hypothetical protein